MTNKDDEIRDLQWFLSRIGKVIFREDNGCDCKSCVMVTRFGVRINDETYAKHLHVLHGDMGLRYYDEPQIRKS